MFSDQFQAAWACSSPVSEVPLLWQRLVSLKGDETPMIVVHRTILTPRQAVTSTLGVFEKLPAQLTFLLPQMSFPNHCWSGQTTYEADSEWQKWNRVDFVGGH